MKILFALLISVIISGCTSASYVVKRQPKFIEPIIVNGQEYRPLNVVDVNYPVAAIESNISGFCTVEFTVAKDGTTKDHEVVECSNGVFKKESLNTAKSLKYSPLRLNGTLVKITGVQHRFTYEMVSASRLKSLKQEMQPRWTAHMAQFCSDEAKRIATEDQLEQCRLARQFFR